MATELSRAQAYITSYKNDSANVILAKIAAELGVQNLLDSPFGLRVQLMQGIAFEHDDRDTTAMHSLLQIKESSQQKKLWDTYTEACLALANLHENMKRSSQCFANLKDARSAIQQHSLDSIFPFFAIRMSSYYRVLVPNVDSATYYAKEVLRSAPRYGLTLQEAWGHMLMAMILNSTKNSGVFEHLSAAILLFRKIDDSAGLSAAMSNIAAYYFRNKEFTKSLVYNDSAIAVTKKSISLGNRLSSNLYSAYQLQGEIYRSLGQLDSAYYYLKKGYDLHLSHELRAQNYKIIEIDARYNDEKRLQEIADQERQIRSEKARRNLLIFIVFVVIVLASILAYFYRQLQKANRKTLQQAEQLKALDMAKSRFFANVSHELRTPLTLVLGPVSSVLKGQQLNPKQLGLLQMAIRNGDRLNQLINEILDLRKLDSGKMELNLQATRVLSFFRNLLVQFESLAYGKDIDFSFDIVGDNETVANIDREKCRQILYNLLSNAFKFTPQGGKIVVKLDVTQNKVSASPTANFRLSVADSGRGIYPEDLLMVFDRFFQTNQSNNPAEGGTGIGLALCKEYATLFGGKVTVESLPEKGATFLVEFPIELIEQESLPQLDESNLAPLFYKMGDVAELTAQATDPAKATILVVEDNPELQDYIRLILQVKYNVVTAENGQVALAKIMRGVESVQSEALSIPWVPDLVISDLMMPVMDGYQLLEKLKSGDATRHLPVIMLTARAEAADRLKALRIGVDDYLGKPFEEEELQVRIENLLNNYRSRRQATLDEAANISSQPQPNTTETSPNISETDRTWLEDFEAYIRKNISSEILSIPGLAHEFAMSESTLLRQLKRLTGLSPLQYLQDMRLDHARRLLEDRSYDSIAKVASMIGYRDTRSFSRTFRQRFGKLPSDFISD
ncbi:MAG: ATP-binding protein [Saprospiraceae bacterium]